ncbi:MAG: glycoside hydrolase N-terminal domain-containing protein, partial [Clostridia bacterium]|nr:glycoside hydrolase N-terminal domain-containing protein [Clostridia bacterium]
MDKLIMYYTSPAENSDLGWERQSLPLGNGYMGANVFGGLDSERIQMTSNELANPLNHGGLNNFSEVYIDFNHNTAENYIRGLNLNNATSFCEYDYNGAHYSRTAFTSYPDNCFALRIECDKQQLA